MFESPHFGILKRVPGPIAVSRGWALASLSPLKSSRARSIVVPYSHLSFLSVCVLGSVLHTAHSFSYLAFKTLL